MATVFDISVVTDAGNALLQSVQANEDTMEFTKVVLGSGTWAAAAMKGATALKSQKNYYSISKAQNDDGNLTITAFLVNEVSGESIVAEDYAMSEIGVIAKNSDNEEILYALAIPSGTAETMPAYTGMNPMEVRQVFTLPIGDADVTVDYSGAYAATEDLEAETQARIEADLEALYGLQNKLTQIRTVDGNKQITERDYDNEVTTVTTVVKTSPTVKTITNVITPDAGNYYYTKVEVVEKVAGGTDITTTVTKNEKEE